MNERLTYSLYKLKVNYYNKAVAEQRNVIHNSLIYIETGELTK